MQSDHHMQRMGRTAAPEGHRVVVPEEFERIAYANRCTIELPGIEGGWATCEIRGQRFATWQRGVPLELKRLEGGDSL